MIRKQRWFWVLLLIWVALLLGTLATEWHVVLVSDYNQMVELARKQFTRTTPLQAPWTSVALGWVAYAAVLATILLFFARLLTEMRLNQQQSEFLAQISHELKTPIAALELSSGLIRSGDLSSEEVERLWESHSAELKRLREDVEALLEAARLQTKTKDSRSQTRIQLETWLKDSLPRWQRILGPHSSIRRTGDPLPVTTNVDIRSFNLITDNLLDNARKYAMTTPQVVIRTRRIPGRGFKKARWQIQIQDAGWGFSTEDSKKIFQRFFRARTPAPYAIPGTGLGLYLASTASRTLGITLRGESAGLGKGATFTLEGAERQEGRRA